MLMRTRGKTQVETTAGAGSFVVEVHESWAPRGATRFKELVASGFYDNTRFFRVLPSFMVQFGISGDPDISAKWRANPIKDDPTKAGSFLRGGQYTETGDPGN